MAINNVDDAVVTIALEPDINVSLDQKIDFKITVESKEDSLHYQIYLVFPDKLTPILMDVKGDPVAGTPVASKNWTGHLGSMSPIYPSGASSNDNGLFVEWDNKAKFSWIVPYDVKLAAGDAGIIKVWVKSKKSVLSNNHGPATQSVSVQNAALTFAVNPEVMGAIQINSKSWVGLTDLISIASGSTVTVIGTLGENALSIYGQWRLKNSSGTWSDPEQIVLHNRVFDGWILGKHSANHPDLIQLQSLLSVSGSEVTLEWQFARDHGFGLSGAWYSFPEYKFSVDLNPPELKNLAIRVDGTKSHLVLQGRMDDSESGIKALYISWDGGTTGARFKGLGDIWTSVKQYKIDESLGVATDISKGIWVWARDNVNNVSTKELVKIDVTSSSSNNAAPHVTWHRVGTALKGQAFQYRFTIAPPMGATFPPLTRIAFTLPSEVTFIQGWMEIEHKGIVQTEPLTKESAIVFWNSSPAFDFITLVIDARVDTVAGEELPQASVTLESDYFNASFTSTQDEHIKPGDPGTRFVPLPDFVLDVSSLNSIEPDHVVLKGTFNQPLLDAVRFQYSLDNKVSWVDLDDVAQAQTTFRFPALDKHLFDFSKSYTVVLRARYQNDPRADGTGKWAEGSQSIEIISEQDHLFGLVYRVSLVPNPASVPDDGSTAITLTATVLDSAGKGIPGLQVSWATDIGTFKSQTTQTNASGQVTASLTSTVRGYGPVDLLADIMGDRLASTTVAFTPTSSQQQDHLQALIDPSSQLVAVPNPAFVDESVTLTATFVDKNNSPIAGLDVSWGNDAGALSVRGLTTNVNGEVKAILTYGELGLVKATVSAGSVSLKTAEIKSKPYLAEFDLDDLSKITYYKAVTVSGRFKQSLRGNVIIAVGKDGKIWDVLSSVNQQDFSLSVPEAFFNNIDPGKYPLYVRARYQSYERMDPNGVAWWVALQPGTVTIDNTVPVLAGPVVAHVEGTNVVLAGKVTAPVAPNNPVTVQVDWDGSNHWYEVIDAATGTPFTLTTELAKIAGSLAPRVKAVTKAGVPSAEPPQKVLFDKLTPELVSVVVAIESNSVISQATTLQISADLSEKKVSTSPFNLRITVTAHVGLPPLELKLNLSQSKASWSNIGVPESDPNNPSGVTVSIDSGWVQSHQNRLATIGSLQQGQSIALLLALTLKSGQDAKNVVIELADSNHVTFSKGIGYQNIHFSHNPSLT